MTSVPIGSRSCRATSSVAGTVHVPSTLAEGLQPDRHHVLDEPGQRRQLLRKLRLPDERPLASPDLDQLEALQLLNGLPHRGPTDAVPSDQLLLRGELTTGSERPAGDRRRQVLLDLEIERDRTLSGSLTSGLC